MYSYQSRTDKERERERERETTHVRQGRWGTGVWQRPHTTTFHILLTHTHRSNFNTPESTCRVNDSSKLTVTSDVTDFQRLQLVLAKHRQLLLSWVQLEFHGSSFLVASSWHLVRMSLTCHEEGGRVGRVGRGYYAIRGI